MPLPFLERLKKLKACMHKLNLAACLVCALVAHSALAGDQAQPPDLVVSKDGTCVSDLRSKLAWSRCAEGMQWNGQTCAGEPHLVSHAEALSLARARSKAEGLPWRVPRVKELQHLVSKAAHAGQGKAVFFPAAPPGWHWAVSVNIDVSEVNPYDYSNIERGVTAQNANRMAFLHGWAVNAQSGVARGEVPKRTKLPVRLVRREK